MRRTSVGEPSKVSRSDSMTSTPSKPTAAQASSLSRKVPLSATVAMHFRSAISVPHAGARADMPSVSRSARILSYSALSTGVALASPRSLRWMR